MLGTNCRGLKHPRPPALPQRGEAVPYTSNVYEVKDDRIRVECEILNLENSFSFTALAMCDGGASSEITLPARKIIQLGLKPFGKSKSSRGLTNNDVKQTLTFAPSVSVKMQFIRQSENEVYEERSALLVVCCHRDEYEECMRNSIPCLDTTTLSSHGNLLSSKRKASDISDSSSSNVIEPKIIKLSPVSHRPTKLPNQRVVLGHNGLHKLCVHGNFVEGVLEIEEEVEDDEE
eukprot:gene18458-26026_t